MERLSSKVSEEGFDGTAKKIAELMVDVLLEAGVKRVYGVSGHSLNGFTDAIRYKSVALKRMEDQLPIPQRTPE